jgi:hypothetical protein
LGGRGSRITSSSPAWAEWRDPVSKHKNKQKEVDSKSIILKRAYGNNNLMLQFFHRD